MITDKEINLLKQRLANGERPTLPHSLWHVLYNWYSWQTERKSQLIARLKELGLLTEKGFPSKLGKWYVNSLNGRFHRGRKRNTKAN